MSRVSSRQETGGGAIKSCSCQHLNELNSISSEGTIREGRPGLAKRADPGSEEEGWYRRCGGGKMVC
jgi:hypothetical protein